MDIFWNCTFVNSVHSQNIFNLFELFEAWGTMFILTGLSLFQAIQLTLRPLVRLQE